MPIPIQTNLIMMDIRPSTTHLRGKRLRRPPLTGLAGRRFLHHLVDLLEGETLHLGHAEVSEQCRADAARAPNEENFGTEVGRVLVVADHVGRDEGDDHVEEPVGGGRDTDAAGANRQGEELTGRC